MGTNYYHEKEAAVCCTRCGNPCEDCERETRIHIGKSSGGWTFGFHATDTIRSYPEWLAALEAGGRIVDEYGRVHTLEDFQKLVESKRSAPNNHADSYARSDGRDFVDAGGHSFSTGEFR